MNDRAREKFLKHATLCCFQWLLSPLNGKYCVWFFQPITLRGSVLVLQMLYFSAVMCGETNLNLIGTVPECTFYSSFRSICTAVKETIGP